MIRDRWHLPSATAVIMTAVVGPFLFYPEVVPAENRRVVVVTLSVLALAMSTLLSRRDDPLKFVIWLFVFATVGAWMVAGPVGGHDPGVSLRHFSGLALAVLLMTTTAAWCHTTTRLLIAAGGFALLAIAALIAGIWGTEVYYARFLPIRWPQQGRWYLPGIDSNGLVNPTALGALAVCIAPVAAALVALPREAALRAIYRTIGIVGLLIVAGVSVITQSRAAWATGFALIVVFALQRYARHWQRVAAAAAVGAALVVGAIRLFFPENFGKMVASTGPDSAERLNLWREAMRQLAVSPWLGIGINQFHPPGSAVRPEQVAHAHNILIQVALDIGVIGLIAYVLLQLILLVRAARAASQSNRIAAVIAAGAGLTILGLHIFGLTDAIALGAKMSHFQWVAAGLVIAAWHLRDHRADNSSP